MVTVNARFAQAQNWELGTMNTVRPVGVRHIKDIAPETLMDCPAGLVAGTQVATRAGWCPIENVACGDQVLTFDGGLQTVMNVRSEIIYHPERQTSNAGWPLLIPAKALGNAEDMLMMPNQAVLVESETAEAVFGDPFAMIPAAALAGFRDIRRQTPDTCVKVVTIQFARDEVIYANIGALFFCPRATDMLGEAAANAAYSVMPMEQAELLIGFLEEEDAGRICVEEARKMFSAVA